MKYSHMFTALAVVIFAVVSSSLMHGAGSNAAEETAIRKAIDESSKQGSAGSRLPDRIFWSGAYKRPIVGSEKGDPKHVDSATGESSIDARVPGSQHAKTEVLRIVVADSHDLAYEYSKSTLEYDLKSGEHVSFDTGILRIWQKAAAEWKVAAVFIRPYDK